MLRLCKFGYVTIRNVSATGFLNYGNRLCYTKTQQKTILQRFYSKKSNKNINDDIQKGPSAFQACKTPNLYDQVPSPEHPWNPMVAAVDRKNRKILIIGTIMLLSTLLILYYIIDFDQKEKPLPLKGDDNCHVGKKAPVIKDPKRTKEIPTSVPYLLIGGGTASFSAFRAIKSTDPYAKVLVITGENYHPYMRPPLSKEMWFSNDEEATRKLMFKQWNGSERSLFYEPPDFYTQCNDLEKSEKGGVSVALGWTVKSLDVINRKAKLEGDHEIEYEKCLIATGARPRNLELFTKSASEIREKVTTYRDICDFQTLLETIKSVQSVAIIGGSFLGSELACSLARYGKQQGGASVNQIFKESGNLGKVLPGYLSEWTTEKVKSEGVNVVSSSKVTDVDITPDDRLLLTLNDKQQLTVDHVIVAIGVEPNTDLAESAELEVDPELGGYLVNTELQARSNLYIAGDCACFYDTRLGRRRVEHHDHAVVTGRLAGENMTGASKPYLHQSMFWSDLGPDVGFEAIGIVDNQLPTVGVFAKCTPKDSPKAVVEETGESDRSVTEQNATVCPPSTLETKEPEDNFGKGVIFYLRDDIIVGIVLWNVFNRMPVARQVLKEERKYDDLNEVAKLFNIHDE